VQKHEERRKDHRDEVLHATEVSNVTDEILRFAGGHPIGMRVGFDVRFPESNDKIVQPQVALGRDRTTALWREIAGSLRFYKSAPIDMKVVARAIEPPAPHPTDGTPVVGPLTDESPINLVFEGGVTYHFSFDLVPGYLARDGDGFCFIEPTEENWRGSPEVFRALIAADLEEPYNVRIFGTLYGDLFGRAPERFTQNRYSPKLFLDGVVSAGIEPCDPPRPYYH
jgi:hypothetical protein